MSDPPEPLTPLSPDDEDAVRRLLAEARHTEPLPADVAARLDGVLAGLSRESAPKPVVVDLAARRRRRNAGRLLVAAAAVIVAGVGVGQVIGTGSSDDSGGGSTVADEAPNRESDETAAGSAGDSQAAPSPLSAPEALAKALPLQLSGADLPQQVQAQLDALPSRSRAQLDQGEPFKLTPEFACQTFVATSDGTRVLPAYVDGKAALLALTPSVDSDPETEAAELVDCATGDSLATFVVTLP